MSDYLVGSSASIVGRNDLGSLADRYMVEFGTGPGSRYIAMRACPVAYVSKSGAFCIEDRSTYTTDDMSAHSGIRAPGAGIPQAQPGILSTMNATLAEFGKSADLDIISDYACKLVAERGPEGIDEVLVAKTTAHALESLEYYLATKLNGANPWDAAAIDCSGSPWTGAVTACVSQLQQAIVGLDWTPNAVILSTRAAFHLRNASDVVLGYGGNRGAGVPLDQQRWGEFWQSFGISPQNVFVGDSDTWGGYVHLFQRGDDPTVEPSGLVLAKYRREGETPGGMLITANQFQQGRMESRYASIVADILVIPELGVRLESVV